MGSLFCDPCRCLEANEHAVKHCQICRESYCQRCADVHKSSKATKDHLLLTISDSWTIVKFHEELNAAHTCSQHDKTFDFYCQEHAQFVCSTCVFTKSNATCRCKHSKLVDISFAGQKLTEHNFSDRINEEMQHVIHQADDSIKCIGDALSKSKKSRENLSEQMKLFVESLQSFVDVVRTQANQIEEKTDHQYSSHEAKCLDTVTELESLKTEAEDCAKLSELFNNIGSSADIFRSAYVIKQRCKKFVGDIDMLKDNASVLKVVVEKSAIVDKLEQRNEPLFRCKTSKLDISLPPFSVREEFNQAFVLAVSECDQTNPQSLDSKLVETNMAGGQDIDDTMSIKDLKQSGGHVLAESRTEEMATSIPPKEQITNNTLKDKDVYAETPHSYSMVSTIHKASDDIEASGEVESNTSDDIQAQNDNEAAMSYAATNDENIEGDYTTRQSVIESVMHSSDVLMPVDDTDEIDSNPNNYHPIAASSILYPECPMNIVYKNCLDVASKLSLDLPRYDSIMCLFDERLVLSDSKNMRLLLLERSGNLLKEMFTQFVPNCLTYISKSRLAVSIMKDNRIAFVKIKGFRMKDIQYIEARFHIKSIRSISADKLLVTMTDKNGHWYIDIIHTNGTHLRTIKTDGFYDYNFTAVQHINNQEDEYQIIYVSDLFDRLKCIDRKGRFVFSYDVSQVADIVTDTRGFVYIIRVNGVIVLNPTGKCCLNWNFKDIFQPTRATFSPSCDRLYIITKHSSKIHVLDIERFVWRTT
ncbi:hypothetical protein ACF0H5_008983 [Mactra antiquata]